MIDKTSIEMLKQRVDIVDIIGGFLELKRSGANFKAVCPFHNDTTPSLHISPSKQIYHCFSCGAGGDAIRFVMEYEKLNYPEALEKVALLTNFVLTYTKDDYSQKNDKKILEQLNLFFIQNLNKTPQALSYLTQRGISEPSIQKFGIGYAPLSYITLNFIKRSFTSKEAIEAGVIGIGEAGSEYSRFIERITFPIHSSSGKIVGFGGRTIINHQSKYVNSPQTKIFNKSRLLYGYHLAREKIIKNKKVIVCEGYLDVVMLHQAGFTEAVATLGTALTNEHLPLLTKGDPKVVLSYDGDSAGIEAAFKASKLLSAHNIEGGVVLFANDMDPADMVQKGLTDKLDSIYANPINFVEFCLEQISKKYNLKEAYEKQKALEESTAYLRTLSSALAYEYAGILAQKLKIRPSLTLLGKKKLIKKEVDKSKFEDTLELSIIKTLLIYPNLIGTAMDIIDASMFKVHEEELSYVLTSQQENPKLRELLLRDEIKVHKEGELISALIPFLYIFYQEKLDKIKNETNLSFEKKSFLIRKIKDIINKLKKGELVPYESFSAF